MAMNNKGGGIGSKSMAKPRQYFTGQPARGINPGHAASHGIAYGNHTMQGTTNYRGPEKFTSSPPSPKLGNAVAQSTVCGRGGSRTVMPAGGQGTHGPVNPGQPAPSGELFPGWPAGKGGR